MFINFVLAICFIFITEASIYTNKIYKWTRNSENYDTVGKNLIDHNYKSVYQKYNPTQCAYECLKDSKCKSFSHNKTMKSCNFHTATHTEYPASYVDDIHMEYHTRDAYSIDVEALGPCGVDACNLHGKCLETKTAEDDIVAICVCDAGWTGTQCETEQQIPQWGAWKPWEECSVTCDKGWQRRTRNCEDAATQQSLPKHTCFGLLADVEYKGCTMTMCPRWNEWGTWGGCSTRTSCGKGIKTRNRTCDNGGVPGVDRYCLGSTTSTTPCYDMSCQSGIRIKGGSQNGEGRVELYNDHKKEWGLICSNQWNLDMADLVCKQVGLPAAHKAITDGRFGNGDGLYGISSITCNGNERTVQMCERNEWSLSSTTCPNNKAAGIQCQVNGAWSLWSGWGECSVTCEDGIQTRTRQCNHPPALYGGRPCNGEDQQTKPCTLSQCPSNGTWFEWSAWTSCDANCGYGMQGRNRTCDMSTATDPCPGDSEETRSCYSGSCAVDGVWKDWSDWGTCSLSCGNGTQVRTRTCDGPHFGGKECDPPGSESQACNTHPCPVHGVEGEWGMWGSCSTTCGDGVHVRQRVCIGPHHGGEDCLGPMEELGPCNDRPCPVDGDWLPWGEWGPCDVSCGAGTQWRERACNEALHGGETCFGDSKSSRYCNEVKCPIHGIWAEWGPWGQCGATCGVGQQLRYRNCTGPFFGGEDCVGSELDTQSCNVKHCPVPGDWFEWTAWSPCTVSCDGGTHARSRVCDMTSYGNLTAPCEGEPEEIGDCHTFPCTPHARTCSAWGQLGLEENTMADVDPDGEEGELESVKVYCDMVSEGGIGVTVIGHDNEERQQVVGYEGAGEFKMPILYNVSLEHAIAVADASAHCKQFLKWECKAALIHNPNGNGVITTGWVNRTGGIADYFSGGVPGSESCACGMNNTCADPGLLCNCDMNDATWREDSGYITIKNDLPVTEFLAGDTGDGDNESGEVTLGPLLCFGEAPYVPIDE